MMKKILLLVGIPFLITDLAYGQTQIFFEAGGGSAHTGWEFENNDTGGALIKISFKKI